jgi:hypothetical protein
LSRRRSTTARIRSERAAGATPSQRLRAISAKYCFSSSVIFHFKPPEAKTNAAAYLMRELAELLLRCSRIVHCLADDEADK